MKNAIKVMACVTSILFAVSTHASNSLQLMPSTSINNLAAVLSGLQKQTSLPVVFPKLIPQTQNSKGLYAYLEPSSNYNNSYQIDIGSTPNCNGVKVCTLGSFSLQKGATPQMQTDINKNVITQKLEKAGKVAYFTPSHAMGDYFPAQLQWVKNGIMYSIAWNLQSQNAEQKTLVKMARSLN